MAHQLNLFIGHPEVLRRYADTSDRVRLFRLTPGSNLSVLPLDDDLHDALHHIYGTGEWLAGPRLTSTDLAFAARTSLLGPLGYVETYYAGGQGHQAAALWSGGEIAIRPLVMGRDQQQSRPQATWPINAVLRGLGTAAAAGQDEFEAFGLGAYRRNEAVAERGFPLRR